VVIGKSPCKWVREEENTFFQGTNVEIPVGLYFRAIEKRDSCQIYICLTIWPTSLNHESGREMVNSVIRDTIPVTSVPSEGITGSVLSPFVAPWIERSELVGLGLEAL
jgi:hypothetical protein